MKNHILLFLCLALIPVRSALGDELKLTPAVTLKEEYNDNIFLTVSDHKSDFISTLSPVMELSKLSERIDAGLLVGCDAILYGRTSDLNSVDQSYQGHLSYAVTPLTSIALQGGYVMDSQPNRDISTTGLIIGAVKRRRQTYSLSAQQVLSEKNALSLNYAYSQDDFDNRRFSATRAHTAGLTFNHDLDWLMRTTKGSVSLNYAHYTSTSQLDSTIIPAMLLSESSFESNTDNFSVSLGGSTSLNELWSVQISAGGRYTLSDSRSRQHLIVLGSPQAATESNLSGRDWGWVGQLSLTYRGELTQGGLSFNSDVAPASGQSSGTTVRTGVVANLTRRFSYELSGGMSIGYFLNKSNSWTFSGQAIDDETLYVSPNIRYEFTRDLFVETFYNYVRVAHNSTANEASQNQFFVKLTIRYPFVM